MSREVHVRLRGRLWRRVKRVSSSMSNWNESKSAVTGLKRDTDDEVPSACILLNGHQGARAEEERL